MSEFNKQPRAKRILHFATAPRATAVKVGQLTDTGFVERWAGRLRGKFIKPIGGGDWRFTTKDEALSAAREFRESARAEAQDLGLI